MSRAIIPIADLKRRPPELGRIRTGVKTGKAMKAITEFRFTSSDEKALQQIADLYGGTVKPWSDDKAAEGQSEVITDAKEIAVALPADPLGGTPQYEKYGGGGRERWCDGVTCETWVNGPEGPEPSDIDCICVAQDSLDCKPTVHLSVLLLGVRGIGTWRLTTHSWNAAQELPGMVELVQSLQTRGIQRATLRLERKRSVQAGQTRKFIVPVLGVDGSVEELVAGSAAIGALTPADARVEELGQWGEERPQIGAGEVPETSPSAPAPSLPEPDDEPIEAEIVDEASPKARFWAALKAMGADGDDGKALRHAVIHKASDGATTNSQQVTADVLEAACELLTQVSEGTWRLDGERLVANSTWLDDQRAKMEPSPPTDADGWRALAKEAGVTQAAIIREAQRLAGEGGPGSLSALVGHDVAADVFAWLHQQAAA